MFLQSLVTLEGAEMLLGGAELMGSIPCALRPHLAGPILSLCLLFVPQFPHLTCSHSLSLHFLLCPE